MDSTKNERATKKQQELLNFIDGFIKGNGFGPSYREIMRALGYKSVSTVASHVDGLIEKGYLEKHGTSARSLVVVLSASQTPSQTHEQWLKARLVEQRQRQPDTADAKQVVAAIDTVAALLGISLE